MIIFATTNPSKKANLLRVKEYSDYHVLMLDEAMRIGIINKNAYQEPEETGTTYRQNALIKANAAFDALTAGIHCSVMADDSGFEIEYLNGEPGIYSARLGGTKIQYSEKRHILMKKMHEKEVLYTERAVKFVCHCTLIDPLMGIHDVESTTCGFLPWPDLPDGLETPGNPYLRMLELPGLGNYDKLEPKLKSLLNYHEKAYREMMQLIKCIEGKDAD